MADDRRKGMPPLVWIVLVLLAVLVVIALINRDGTVTSPDSRVTMPVDLPDAPATVDPAPTPVPTPTTKPQ